MSRTDKRYAALEARLAKLEAKGSRVAEEVVDETELDEIEARLAALEESLDEEDVSLADDGEDFTEDDVELVEDDDIEAEDMSDSAVESLTGDDDDDDDDSDDVVESSIVDPDGVEERITQDFLSEMQGITHGEQLTTAPSMLDVARKAYVARMRAASARLDRVAEYLEKQGKVETAYKVDRLADEIDANAKEVAGRMK